MNNMHIISSIIKKVQKHKRRSFLLIFVFFIFLFFLFFIIFAYRDKYRIAGIYEEGVNLYNQQKYEECIKKLSEIGNYKDSIEYIDKAKNWISYKEAVNYYENGEYESAYQIFLKLGDFEDSRDYIIKTQLPEVSKVQSETYNEAISYYNNKEYEKAGELFAQLSDYKDSIEMSQKCVNGLKRLQLSNTICAGVNTTVAISETGEILISNTFEEGVDFSEWNNIVSISGYGYLYIGLDADGKVYSTGKFGDYDTDVSDKEEWDEEFIGVAAGEQYIIGLKADGHVVHLGRNYENQKDCENWENIVYIASGRRTIVGIDDSGKLYIAGQDAEKLQEYVDEHSEQWSDLVMADAGGSGESGTIHIVGLKADKTVVAYMIGSDVYGKCAVEGWSNIKKISAGDNHTVAIDSNNKVISIGYDGTKDYPGKGYLDKIDNWENVLIVSAGTNYTVAVLKNEEGKIITVGAGYEDQGQIDCKYWNNVRVW
jgi:tetratricopeptide (TPR) repeat protein